MQRELMASSFTFRAERRMTSKTLVANHHARVKIPGFESGQVAATTTIIIMSP